MGEKEERLVAEEKGSVAKEIEPGEEDRAGQGWSMGGRAIGKEVARRVMMRDGCRVRRVHTHSR